jgi:ABC-type amino acid transport substrate-binding protein
MGMSCFRIVMTRATDRTRPEARSGSPGHLPGEKRIHMRLWRRVSTSMAVLIMAAAGCLWEAPAGAQPAGRAGAAGAPDALAAIRARAELRACIWPDDFAISYRNPRKGEPEGIDIDPARDFARRLGVGLAFVEASFRHFMDRLDQRACDAAMFGVDVTPEGAARVAFSEPYLVSGVYAVTTGDNQIIRRWGDLDR